MILRLLAGILSILATWTALLAISIGIGLTLRRACGVKEVDVTGLFASCWLGICLTVLFLQIWHLLLPIGWPAFVAVVAMGSVGLFRSAPELWGWVGRMHWREHRVLIAVLILASCWVANHAMGPLTAYDSGMYHLPVITWAKHFPTVPGLGNLHGRLAFNNASLLYAALVEIGPWSGRSNHLVNGLFLFVLLLQLIIHSYQLPRAHGRQRAHGLFDLTLLTPVLLLVQDANFISSLTIDVPTAVVLFGAASRLFAQLVDPKRPHEPREHTYNLVVLTAMLTVAVCFKLSALGFSVTAWLLAVTWWLWHDPGSQRVRTLTLSWVITLTLALGLSWAGRGVILSGYPAYPSRIGAVPVDWRVPPEQADAERAWIRFFARHTPFTTHPAPDQHDLWHWQWLRPWLASAILDAASRWQITLPALLTGVLLSTRLLRRRRVSAAVYTPAGWALLLPTVAGIAFWFVTAPRPVFGSAMVWILAAACAGQTATAALDSARPRSVSALLLASLLVGLPVGMYLGSMAIQQLKGGRKPLTALRRELIVRPGSDLWFHPTPRAQLERFTTGSGLHLYVPQNDNRCFDAPLPCTPHPAWNLRLRRGEALEAGFAVNGPWRPLRWPHPWTSFLASWRAYRAGTISPELTPSSGDGSP
jgi:hypothetical protein